MLSPVIMHEIAKARHSDLLKQAEAHRLARQAKNASSEASQPAAEELSARIVETGERLTERRATPNGAAA